MKHFPTTLGIDLHLLDGSVNRFHQDRDSSIRLILKELDPTKVFSKQRLTIEWADGISIFPTSSVVRMDLVMDVDPGWNIPGVQAEIQEITREEFERSYQPKLDPKLTRSIERETGERYRGFLHILLANRERAIIKINSLIASKVEQWLMVEPVMKQSTLFFRRAGEGYCFLNVAKILRIDILPGQPNIAPNAWRAEPVAG